MRGSSRACGCLFEPRSHSDDDASRPALAGHSPYDIETVDGTLVKHVRNYDGGVFTEPDSVALHTGGKARSVMVDLDQDALYAKGVSPFAVSTALANQNVILPAGTAKIGPIEYNVRTNSSPDILETLNDLPVKQVGGATIYMRDIAQVRDGFAVQTNMVHVDGRLSALLAVLRTPTASTLDIVQRVKGRRPRLARSTSTRTRGATVAPP